MSHINSNKRETFLIENGRQERKKRNEKLTKKINLEYQTLAYKRT